MGNTNFTRFSKNSAVFPMTLFSCANILVLFIHFTSSNGLADIVIWC